MGTPIYLSNDASDISGYKKAYIGFPGPNASTTVSTAVTTTTNSGSNIDMTLTAGGTTAKWITAPFLSDVAIAAIQMNNVWCKEDAAATNSQVQIVLKEYTTSAQSAFQTSAYGTEAGTTIAQNQWSKAIDTPTTIDAGNRLIIQPQVTNVGTMAAGTFTMDYNGSTAGADGDTFIMISEVALAQNSQFGSGSSPLIAGDGPSTMPYGDWVRELDPVASVMSASPNQMTWGAFRDELLAQAGDQSSTSASIQSA